MCWSVQVGISSSTEQTWMRSERRLTANWRQQVCRNRLALSARWCLRLSFFFSLNCFRFPSPTRTQSTHRFLVEHFYALWHFLFYPHTYTHRTAWTLKILTGQPSSLSSLTVLTPNGVTGAFQQMKSHFKRGNDQIKTSHVVYVICLRDFIG